MSTRPFRARTRVTADDLERALGGPTRVRGVTVPCLDLPAALRFYGDGLGLRLAGQARGHAILDAGGVRLVLLDAVQVPGFHKESGQGLFLELAVADLGAVAARLEASGLRLSTPRPSRAGRVLSVEDPEGNVVSLIETGALRSF